jgi:hypothetical protein
MIVFDGNGRKTEIADLGFLFVYQSEWKMGSFYSELFALLILFCVGGNLFNMEGFETCKVKKMILMMNCSQWRLGFKSLVFGCRLPASPLFCQ